VEDDLPDMYYVGHASREDAFMNATIVRFPLNATSLKQTAVRSAGPPR